MDRAGELDRCMFHDVAKVRTVTETFNEATWVTLATHVVPQSGKDVEEAIIEAIKLPAFAAVELLEVEGHDGDGAVMEYVRTIDGPQLDDFHDSCWEEEVCESVHIVASGKNVAAPSNLTSRDHVTAGDAIARRG